MKLLAAVLLPVSFAAAQSTDVTTRMTSVRQPVVLREGRLTGPGADTIRAALRNARFVLIGEDHGLAEIPAFSSAVFVEAAPLGFRNLFVEIGPLAGRRMNRMLASADPDAQAADWARRYPFSLAFYNWHQEFEFLKNARRAAGNGLRLFGIDQELMGASRMILDSIPASPQRDELLRQEEAAYSAASKSGNPMELFMMTAKPESLIALRDNLRSAGRAADAGAVDSLLVSRAIYDELPKSQVGSNIARGLLMKRQYEAQTPRDGDGVPEKAVFKFGAIHMMKGLSTVNNREIGNHVAEIAEGVGQTSLHILILAAKGNQRRFAGIGKPAMSAPVDQVGPGQSDFPYAKPMFDVALDSPRDSGAWSLFDFRALRDWADRARDLDPRMVKLIFGFDLAIVIPQGTPSDEIR